MPSIEITISPSGEVKIEPKGVAGDKCLDLTKTLENALGEVESRECKTEFFEETIDANDEVTLEE